MELLPMLDAGHVMSMVHTTKNRDGVGPAKSRLRS